MLLFKSKLLNNNVRDYTDVETPCSISNQEAKHIVGDDTTPYWQGESSSLRTLFFSYLLLGNFLESNNLNKNIMDTEQTKEMIAKIKDTLKQVFDVEDSDFVVQGSTEEYTVYSDAYSEFALKQYIYYIIKPTNHKTRFKLRLRDDKIKFEIKIFEDFPIMFENFDFSMPIFVGNDTDETDNIYQPISFCDCNIEFVNATAINNTFALQRISFERCDIKELQIHKTIFAEEISFYRNVILYVSLSNCVFQKNLYFNHSIFEKKIDFRESEFEKVVCFYGAKFKKAPNFSACYFKEPRAVNLVNIDIDGLDFKQVEDYIKDNFKDEWCKQEIAKSQNKDNKDKEIEIEQKYRLRYAQNAKDSFRAIKDILIGQNNTLEAQEWHKLELYAKENELAIRLKQEVQQLYELSKKQNLNNKKKKEASHKSIIDKFFFPIECIVNFIGYLSYNICIIFITFVKFLFFISLYFLRIFTIMVIWLFLSSSEDGFLQLKKDIKHKILKLNRYGRNMQDFTTWTNFALLYIYRNTSDHHTNFIKILNFTAGMIVLYGAVVYFFNLYFKFLMNYGYFTPYVFFTPTLLIFCLFVIILSNENSYKFSLLIFCFWGSCYIFSMFLHSYIFSIEMLFLYVICILIFYYLFVCKIRVVVFILRLVSYLGFLYIVIGYHQLINPFIGIFSSDKLFESKFEQQLSDLNSSTILNLAKISQKDFILQDDCNVPFAELNSAKIVILSNRKNIVALKDENLTKTTDILGNALYNEISQAIQQDKILSDTIKSTSIIYSIILLLCIFSIQKTARKNSIIPS